MCDLPNWQAGCQHANGGLHLHLPPIVTEAHANLSFKQPGQRPAAGPSHILPFG